MLFVHIVYLYNRKHTGTGGKKRIDLIIHGNVTEYPDRQKPQIETPLGHKQMSKRIHALLKPLTRHAGWCFMLQLAMLVWLALLRCLLAPGW